MLSDAKVLWFSLKLNATNVKLKEKEKNQLTRMVGKVVVNVDIFLCFVG
ncbi:MAG: hypothetical protein NHF95_00010 [Candidatus Shikimatogenerans sp. JK-2022]|nr:hypothetical protein [Candidatus Shikimatogenerans bostrichidophilus]